MMSRLVELWSRPLLKQRELDCFKFADFLIGEGGEGGAADEKGKWEFTAIEKGLLSGAQDASIQGASLKPYVQVALCIGACREHLLKVHAGVWLAPNVILHKLGPSLHFALSSASEFLDAYPHTDVCVLHPSGGLSCSNNCGRSDAAFLLRLCGRCRVVSYCSRECQRAAWALHKIACVAVQKR
jgi:hypothetical protein